MINNFYPDVFSNYVPSWNKASISIEKKIRNLFKNLNLKIK